MQNLWGKTQKFTIFAARRYSNPLPFTIPALTMARRSENAPLDVMGEERRCIGNNHRRSLSPILFAPKLAALGRNPSTAFLGRFFPYMPSTIFRNDTA